MQESAFGPEELRYYEKYWDTVSIEKTAIAEAIEKEQKKQTELIEKAEVAEAKAEQERAKAEQERTAKEAVLARLKNSVIKQHKNGKSLTEIADDFELSLEEVKRIVDECGQ